MKWETFELQHRPTLRFTLNKQHVSQLLTDTKCLNSELSLTYEFMRFSILNWNTKHRTNDIIQYWSYFHSLNCHESTWTKEISALETYIHIKALKVNILDTYLDMMGITPIIVGSILYTYFTPNHNIRNTEQITFSGSYRGSFSFIYQSIAARSGDPYLLTISVHVSTRWNITTLCDCQLVCG